MEITLTTPALLFPTISLLLIAYTNRFMAIGNRIRNLHTLYQEEKKETIFRQINILRKRIQLIRDLQLIGISSLFFCILTMFFIFENLIKYAKHCFVVSLVLMMVSFGLAAWEIILSTRALNIQLKDLEDLESKLPD
jgi:hypothetical protein